MSRLHIHLYYIVVIMVSGYITATFVQRRCESSSTPQAVTVAQETEERFRKRHPDARYVGELRLRIFSQGEEGREQAEQFITSTIESLTALEQANIVADRKAVMAARMDTVDVAEVALFHPQEN